MADDDLQESASEELLRVLRRDLEKLRRATQQVQLSAVGKQELKAKESQEQVRARRHKHEVRDAVRESQELLAKEEDRAALLELRSLRNRFEESLKLEEKQKARLHKRISLGELIKQKAREAVAQPPIQAADSKKSLLEAATSKKSLEEAVASKKSLPEAVASKKSLPETVASQKSLPETASEEDKLAEQNPKEEVEDGLIKKSKHELNCWEILELKIEEELRKSSHYHKELRLIQSIERLRQEIEKREVLEKLAKEELRRKCQGDLEEHEQATREEQEKREIEEDLDQDQEASDAEETSEETPSEKVELSASSSSSSVLPLAERRSQIRRAWRQSCEMWEAAVAVRDQCLEEVERVEAEHKKFQQRLKAGQDQLCRSSPSFSSSGRSSAGPFLSMVGQYCPNAHHYMVDRRPVAQWSSPLSSYRRATEDEEEEVEDHQERLKGGQSSPEAATISSVEEEEPTCMNLLEANGRIFSNLLETTNILNGHLEAHLGSGYNNEVLRDVHLEAKRMMEQAQSPRTEEMSLQWRRLAVKLLYLLSDELHQYYDLVDAQYGLH